MAEVLRFTGQSHTARKRLADFLREIADAIESDRAETEPHAFVMCLTGPTRHEVIGDGYQSDPEGWRGARAALAAIQYARFKTEGGNMRKRDHRMYGRPSDEKLENFASQLQLRTVPPETAP
jgi:hypothetical protein